MCRNKRGTHRETARLLAIPTWPSSEIFKVSALVQSHTVVLQARLLQPEVHAPSPEERVVWGCKERMYIHTWLELLYAQSFVDTHELLITFFFSSSSLPVFNFGVVRGKVRTCETRSGLLAPDDFHYGPHIGRARVRLAAC